MLLPTLLPTDSYTPAPYIPTQSAQSVSYNRRGPQWIETARTSSLLRIKAQIKKPAPDGAGLYRANFGEFTVQISQHLILNLIMVKVLS